MVCPAQRPLAAGKSRQTSDDVGDGAGAGHAAGFSHRLSRRLLLAEYTNAGLLLTFLARPLVFISLMVAIAVLCSWVGALCWNVASQRLPTVILGPLIVFETLAGLLYTFLLRQQMPPLMTLSGIALLVIGVVIAVRAKPEKPLTESVSES